MKIFKKALGLPSSSKDNNDNNTQKQKPSSKHPLSQPPIPPGYYGAFPTTFSIYFSGQSEDKKTDYFILGLEGESNGQTVTPLNAIAFYRRTAKHQLTLFSGPEHSSTSSPVLALAGIERYGGSTHLIALPAQEPGPGGIAANRIIRLKGGGGGLKYDIYRFKLDVGHQHTESFEWRTGNMLRPEENKPFKRWLVRLASGSDPDSPDREEEEVVGTWVEEEDTTTKQTTAKMGTFRFQGSAATGYLGAYCTLGVVVSLLRINQIHWVTAQAVDTMVESAGKMALGGVAIGAGFI